MSGHSKFANIKHKKEKNDAAKGKVFTKIGREIAVAVKEGGGADPANNSRLRDAIAKAKANNMPNDNIDRSIKKAAGDGDANNYEHIVYEGYGPNGTAIIVDALTDNRNRTAADVRHVFSKYGGNMGETGCVNWMFKRKGVFSIDSEAGYTEDDLMLIALEAGAEDVKAEEEGFEIVTEPEDFDAVEKALADNNIEVMMSEIAMLPDTMAELSDEDVVKVRKMLEALEDLDDVQDVYTNADLPEEDEE
jgi:YebC/PmpR family DNA-binding regulatory protein